jgi:hypothetical protein
MVRFFSMAAIYRTIVLLSREKIFSLDWGEIVK